ncbi:MAG: hypothetical protein ACXU9G_02925 [Syntrophales bacterium]
MTVQQKRSIHFSHPQRSWSQLVPTTMHLNRLISLAGDETELAFPIRCVYAGKSAFACLL